MSQEGRSFTGEGMKYVSLPPAFDRQPSKTKKARGLTTNVEGVSKNPSMKYGNQCACLSWFTCVRANLPNIKDGFSFLLFSFFEREKEIRGRPLDLFFFSQKLVRICCTDDGWSSQCGTK